MICVNHTLQTSMMKTNSDCLSTDCPSRPYYAWDYKFNVVKWLQYQGISRATGYIHAAIRKSSTPIEKDLLRSRSSAVT